MQGKAMAKRLLGYLLAALLLTPLFGVADAAALGMDAPYAPEPAYQQEIPYVQIEWTVCRLLALMAEQPARSLRSLSFFDWYVHQSGLAFRIPDGYSLVERKSQYITLADMEDKTAVHRTSIAVNISKEPISFPSLEKNRLIEAYSGIFSQFSLLRYSRESVQGAEGVHVSFVTGTSPQLMVRQCLLNQGGSGYYITITMENRLSSVLKGLFIFDAFIESLRFAPSLSE